MQARYRPCCVAACIALVALQGCVSKAVVDPAQAADKPGFGNDACEARRAMRPRSMPVADPGRRASPDEARQLLQQFSKSPTAAVVLDQLSVTADQARTSRANVTTVSHDPSHGTQVSFTAADGRIFLWYPGNPMILPGRWQVCEDKFIMKSGAPGSPPGPAHVPYGLLCFQYGPNTYNPATGSKGQAWECAAAGRMAKTLVDSRAGDVFGLATKSAVPFVLPREKATIAELLATMRKSK